MREPVARPEKVVRPVTTTEVLAAMPVPLRRVFLPEIMAQPSPVTTIRRCHRSHSRFAEIVFLRPSGSVMAALGGSMMAALGEFSEFCLDILIICRYTLFFEQVLGHQKVFGSGG
jgi:hypothetical protein